MLHTLSRSLRENKGPALVTVLLSALEVVFEIVIPLFIMGALAGFTNIFKMAKKIYGQDGGRKNVTKDQ